MSNVELQTTDQILDHVKGVLNQRAEQYDDPINNFNRIASIATELIGYPFDGMETALFDLSQKMARLGYMIASGEGNPTDTIVDVIGYAVCLLRVWQHEAEKAQGEYDDDDSEDDGDDTDDYDMNKPITAQGEGMLRDHFNYGTWRQGHWNLSDMKVAPMFGEVHDLSELEKIIRAAMLDFKTPKAPFGYAVGDMPKVNISFRPVTFEDLDDIKNALEKALNQ